MLEIQRTNAEASTNQKRNTGAMLARISQLWVPLSKKLVLAGIRSQGTIIREQSGITKALATAWGGIFKEKPFNETAARSFLAEIPLGKPDIDTPPPTEGDFAEYIKHQVDSGTGPDGIPYSGWKATGGTGVSTLHQFSSLIQRQLPTNPDFNSSLIYFIPKGEQPEDANEIIRAEFENRPNAHHI